MNEKMRTMNTTAPTASNSGRVTSPLTVYDVTSVDKNYLYVCKKNDVHMHAYRFVVLIMHNLQRNIRMDMMRKN